MSSTWGTEANCEAACASSTGGVDGGCAAVVDNNNPCSTGTFSASNATACTNAISGESCSEFYSGNPYQTQDGGTITSCASICQ